MLDDWVKNKETEEYEWKDNVKSVEETPEGYTYIGPEDDDILKDLNLPLETEEKSDKKIGGGLEGDDKSGAPILSEVRTTRNINIKADVSYYFNNATRNNKFGKRFEGVSFKGNLTQSSKSGNSDFNMNYKGYFSIKYGNSEFTDMLTPIDFPVILPQGATGSQGNISIPASKLSGNKIFRRATISAGTTNPNLIFSPKPIKMTWSLSSIPVIH
jgi:hypothetical protein